MTTQTQPRHAKLISREVMVISGVKSPVELVTAKIEGTTLVDNKDGTCTLTLPKGLEDGRGGLNHCVDADGEFAVAHVIPAKEP